MLHMKKLSTVTVSTIGDREQGNTGNVDPKFQLGQHTHPHLLSGKTGKCSLESVSDQSLQRWRIAGIRLMSVLRMQAKNLAAVLKKIYGTADR